MPPRRRVLSRALGLAGTAIGAGYGTGAFARLTAERDFALAIANEAGSQLPIEPQGVASNAGRVVAHALDRDDAGRPTRPGGSTAMHDRSPGPLSG